MTPLGTLTWTASAAVWLVLGHHTQLMEASLTGIGCLLMAALWHWVQKK